MPESPCGAPDPEAAERAASDAVIASLLADAEAGLARCGALLAGWREESLAQRRRAGLRADVRAERSA